MVSGKFELLDRMLPKLIKTGHKVLIFSQFVQLLNVMSLYLDYRQIHHLKLDGGMGQEDRQKNMETFENDPKFQVFLLSTRAGGQGLNLQVADTVIIFDSDFNPQMDRQAEDRAHRIGQKHEVRVFRLITLSRVEEGILSRATSKKDLDNIVIQHGGFNQNEKESQEKSKSLENLIFAMGDENDVEGNPEDQVFTDEQLNEVISRGDQEFDIFNKMDEQRYLDEGRAERLAVIREKKPAKKDVPDEKINYRLIQDWEVPTWITESVKEEV